MIGLEMRSSLDRTDVCWDCETIEPSGRVAA
jgi:hypothetical protein